VSAVAGQASCAAGRGHCDFKFVAFLAPRFYLFSCLRSHKTHILLGLYGGDDGARTRDLCRDRAAL
jgi:hypothetical protein